MLLYAWLVDRLVPRPGQPPAQVDAQLSELVSLLPRRQVDLSEMEPLALGPLTHAELAAACLIARYGPGPSATGVPIVLHATRRSKLPSPIPEGAGVLAAAYGDVISDWLRSSALAGMLAGVGQARDEQQGAVVQSTLAALLAPGGLEQLSALFEALPMSGDERGLDRMPGVAAQELPAFAAMLTQGLEDLRRLQDSTARRPMSQEQFLFTLFDLVQAGPEALLADDCPIDIAKMPDVDPTLNAEARAMFDRMDRQFRQAVSEELIDAASTASPAAAVEAIVRVRREQP